MKLSRLLILACTIGMLSGCSSVSNFFDTKEDDAPLPGERISVLELQKDLEPGDMALDAQGFIAPPAWQNEFWPQAGGYPNHSMQHVNLNPDALTRVWKAKIGKGSLKDRPLTAQPIIIDKRVYTLDSNARLSAFSTENGSKIWDVDLRDKKEDDAVIGGGMSYSRGIIYVTNGYSQICAIDPSSGDVLWKKKTPAPSRAAPTVISGRIFIVTLDNKIIALDSEKGDVLWEFAGISETSGIVGAASPAASREIVIPAFSSGEIFALRVENGSVAWADNLASVRQGSGLSSLSDIKALPIIDKGLVVAISFGGRIVAIDARTGNRVWSREIGGSQTPWVAGNHVFIISSKNELIALGRENGVIRWNSQLQRFKKPGNVKSGRVFWSGPVLAGDRLVMASSHGHLLEVNPATGEVIRIADIGKSIRTAPVVADDILYLLAEDGTLLAYR